MEPVSSQQAAHEGLCRRPGNTGKEASFEYPDQESHSGESGKVTDEPLADGADA